MSILKLFLNHLLHDDSERQDDPLQHPALAAMSLEELADLPLTPENLGRKAEGQDLRLKECV
ncbi:MULTISPECIES: hypothetical protein [unclassified Rhizobium]|uniref:hypothetical protein n=1 Tax=unclassified Rhizobium TaxID=2613769 RepID=UPI000CDF3647|nr:MULTISPECIES: hypothetical protein [Rhizobium]AVA20735.1 hypothetical protein NXC24_CH01068 [Rhizobium sp. NXC24]MDK4738880.1 hypothetical protein [Rhizobium sp. CNPSo 3464]UWU21950.1 hypothetical protein N2601_02930 [Rhizobium tropici]